MKAGLQAFYATETDEFGNTISIFFFVGKDENDVLEQVSKLPNRTQQLDLPLQ